LNYAQILEQLEELRNDKNIAGMRRYGITFRKAYGLSSDQVRTIARQIGKDRELAARLWKSNVYELRCIAYQIEDPSEVNSEQMESWVKDLDSWSLCDGCIQDLFSKNRFAHEKADEWTSRDEEFVKRAGFVLIAKLAFHDKKASDSAFIHYLSIIKRESNDKRNFVRKSVNWALREIGKRNRILNKIALETAKQIQRIESKSARWIASDAIRELSSVQAQRRLAAKQRTTRSHP
jgi:3-methyladenine DNA glycosylase AlkD